MKIRFVVFGAFVSVILILSANTVNATEKIVSGQPGQSIGSDILSSGYLQYQTNLDFSNTEDVETSSWVGVLRYGMNSSLELSGVIKTSYISDSGSTDWALGFRYKILGEQDVLPLVFQFRAGRDDNDSSFNSVLSSGGILTKKSSWGFNLNHVKTNYSDDKVGYALNFGYSIGSKLSVFIENYGFSQNQKFWTYFDTGFAYLINKDLQFDASLGYGNTRGVRSYFINVGLSGRFKV